MRCTDLSPLFRICFVLLFSCVALSPLQAAEELELNYYFPENSNFDPAVPTPDAVVGYLPGELHWHPEHIVRYMRVLAERSDRVEIEEYARSHQQRPLTMLTISAPANLARRAEILQERKQVREGGKAETMVVWLGYGVHGNEASASNAAVMMAYYLAAARDPFVESLLQNTVVLLDPVYNPDGLARFTQWVNSFHGPVANPDPQHYEHHEAWPRGRTNHFWFDLNRDWLPAQHPESQGRLRLYHEWLPHVLTDVHEMGGHRTYFFQPGISSRNNPLTPPQNYEMTRHLAEHHGRALDGIGSLYYTGESFDDFYIGKGSTYPDINGSIGILFEQGSARGHARETDNGTITFPFAIRNQITTSLSTLRGAQDRRQELIDYQAKFFRTAREDARTYAVDGAVFGDENDRSRLRYMLDLLLNHNIKVRPLTNDVTLDGQEFKAGAAYVVDFDQPQHRLIRSMFERRTQFRDSLFYDVSAWTIPLAFGIPSRDLSAGRLAGLNLGEVITESAAATVTPIQRGALAYAFSWSEFNAARMLNKLLEAGVRVRLAPSTFRTSSSGSAKSFEGTHVIVPLGLQEDKRQVIEDMLDVDSQLEGVQVWAIDAGLSIAGADLGSPSLGVITQPDVGLLVGDGIYGPSAGAVWHLLEHRIGLGVSLLDIHDLNNLNLERYSDIVVTSGWFSAIDSSAVDVLRGWVQRGGKLIATEDAVAWLAKFNMLNITMRKRDDADSTRRPYSKLFADRGAQNVGGVIVGAQVDLTHPLAYGMQRDTVAFMRTSDYFIEMPRNRYAVPFVYTENPVMSGYLSPQNAKLLSGSAAVLAQRLGRGRVIMLADHPAFRAKWFGASKILLNALYFGDMINGAALRLD